MLCLYGQTLIISQAGKRFTDVPISRLEPYTRLESWPLSLSCEQCLGTRGCCEARRTFQLPGGNTGDGLLPQLHFVLIRRNSTSDAPGALLPWFGAQPGLTPSLSLTTARLSRDLSWQGSAVPGEWGGQEAGGGAGGEPAREYFSSSLGSFKFLLLLEMKLFLLRFIFSLLSSFLCFQLFLYGLFIYLFFICFLGSFLLVF